MIDKTAEQIDKVFYNEFLTCANNAKVYGRLALFFIYYSGHGVLKGADTEGLAFDGSRI